MFQVPSTKAVAVILKNAYSPTFKSPISTNTSLPVILASISFMPSSVTTLTLVTPVILNSSGTVSLITTPVPLHGPALVTLMVNMTVSPISTSS